MRPAQPPVTSRQVVSKSPRVPRVGHLRPGPVREVQQDSDLAFGVAAGDPKDVTDLRFDSLKFECVCLNSVCGPDDQSVGIPFDHRSIVCSKRTYLNVGRINPLNLPYCKVI